MPESDWSKHQRIIREARECFIASCKQAKCNWDAAEALESRGGRSGSDATSFVKRTHMGQLDLTPCRFPNFEGSAFPETFQDPNTERAWDAFSSLWVHFAKHCKLPGA